MSTLKGKRLLVLGGTISTYEIVLHAKRRGVYVIVTDYLPSGIAKRIADETAMISTSDLDTLESFAIEKKIDGIFTGPSEVNIKFVQQLCERLNLPFYATKEQFEVSMNKKRFKQLCKQCGIPTAKEYSINSLKDLNKVQDFPVIVKPVDGYSSKGISICHNKEELVHACQNAKNYSPTDEILVEKYIEGYDDICMYYTIQNGHLTLSAMTDRDMNHFQVGKAPQPNALFFPSKHLDTYMEVLHKKVELFAHELFLQNGTMFIQAFIKGKEFIVFEMGYRLCGANEYIMISRENGIDTLDMYLNMALTGKFAGWDNQKNDNPYFRNNYCILVPLLKQGTICSCTCLEKIKVLKEVIYIQQFYQEGDTVSENSLGTLEQTLARIYICAETEEALKKAIKKVQNLLIVNDINGNNMILPGLLL